jgi:hypothetical protein
METKTRDLIYEKTAHSFQEFVSLVEEAKKHLVGDPNDSCEPPEFWYRGHDRDTYTLTPSLFRYYDAEEMEERLFKLHAEIEIAYPGQQAISWETVFKMQHYGIPTRLLDWTAKLWIAVFFALTRNAAKPCIYILNPSRLNRKNAIHRTVRVPEDRAFEFQDTFFPDPSRPVLHPLAIVPKPLYPRMRSQCSRFTVQGKEREPLERQSPNSVARIFLSESASKELKTFLDDANVTAVALFPDHEGIARHVIAEADLRLLPYDAATASEIRLHLRQRADDIKGFGPCNLGAAYISRAAEESQMVDWLKNGPPVLFVTGEAGIGKTNFVLHCLLEREEFQTKPFVFFSFKRYGSQSPDELVRHLYEVMIGTASTDHEQRVARQMIWDGAVGLALDGLDELARVKSQEAVEAVAQELDRLVGGSQDARVVISCRDHILERLRGTGALGNNVQRAELRIKSFDLQTMRQALEHELGPDAGKLAAVAATPLLYEMIRQARRYLDRLVAASGASTRLQEEWFKVMLEARGQSSEALGSLGAIAGTMLQSRSDLLEINSVDADSQKLIRELSVRPFALFTEELRDTFSFSHQSLREFVLAWCVAQEIKTRQFKLLTVSSSFDYEGAEFYERVSGVLDITRDVVQQLHRLLDSPGLNEVQWNNLARNLFEMIGELMPDDATAAEAVVQVALRYIDPAFEGPHYVSYKTRYNVVRCLERIHYSAPRDPYFQHILHYHWSGKVLNRDHIAAHAVRGFHMKKQKPGSLPPTVFNDRKPTAEAARMDVEVSNALLGAIEALTSKEVPEDADFFGLNCTLALIRWLPQEPDLDRLGRLLRHRHTSVRMRQNIVYALFRRYGLDIPGKFLEGSFPQGGSPRPRSGERTFAGDEDTEALWSLMESHVAR